MDVIVPADRIVLPHCRVEQAVSLHQEQGKASKYEARIDENTGRSEMPGAPKQVQSDPHHNKRSDLTELHAYIERQNVHQQAGIFPDGQLLKPRRQAKSMDQAEQHNHEQ